jgi:solute carrier family 39 (zinc transporter), member 1/2/3
MLFINKDTEVTLLAYKIIAALLIFISSIFAVIYPIKKHFSSQPNESLELGEAFASGIFLGVAFFHMFPASIASFHQLWGDIRYPVAELICILGFIALLFLERLSMMTNHRHIAGIPYILTIMLVIHSLIEGAALGINATLAQAVMIFIAIIAHKGSASFALCVTLMRHKIALRNILVIVLLFSLVTPTGIFLGATLNSLTYLPQGKILEACFNAFATGSFFYMATLHHVQFHKRAPEEAHGLLEFFFLVLGLVMMGVVAIWL